MWNPDYKFGASEKQCSQIARARNKREAKRLSVVFFDPEGDPHVGYLDTLPKNSKWACPEGFTSASCLSCESKRCPNG